MIRIAVCLLAHLLLASSVVSHSLPENRMLQQAQSQNCTVAGTGDVNAIGLGMCGSQIFIMPMSIGTPPQQLYFIVNTNNAILEVLTNQNNPIGFNTQNSTTLQLSNQVVMIDMPNGEQVASNVGNDFVSINNGSINGRSDMLIASQYVKSQNWEIVSGVAGLGLSMQIDNILEVAFNNEQVGTPSYTLSCNASGQSYLYYNQLPPSIIDNSIFIQSSTLDEYSLHIIGLFAGQTEYSSGAPHYAVVASAVSYFYLNQKVYDAVTSHFFNQCTQTPAGPTCLCSQTANWPTFSLMFEGAQIYIPAQNYLLNLPDGNCTYGFGYVQNERNVMILGSSFFLNYNLTFDPLNARIGMQGHLTPIQVVDFASFVAFSYIFLIVAIGMAVSAGFLVWYLRVVEKEKPTRIIQFSISDRFIETD